jgi:hypothetical protein
LTHALQPLDVGIFHPWKHYHKLAIQAALRSLDFEYTITSFFRDLTSIRQQTFKYHTIINSFRDTGIWPPSAKAGIKHTGHELVDDSLIYPEHMKRLEDYQTLLRVEVQHRQAVIPYSDSRRVLEAINKFGITLTSRQYYNSVRNSKGDKTAPETIGGLLITLDEAGFVYRTRIDIEENSQGQEIRLKLIQIGFTHPSLIEATKKSVADFLCVIDGTFNTNNLRMPILIAVGVLNSGRTFLIAFSYCPSESKESYSLFWKSLKAFCFTDTRDGPATVPPRVILGDQAGGILASVHIAFPSAQVQNCDRHAVEAMETKYRRSGYWKDKIQGWVDDNGKYHSGLKDLSWAYVKSATIEQLEENRQSLLDALKSEDQDYILDTWLLKEKHPVLRQITNAQLSLEDSARNLCRKVTSILKDLNTDEQNSMRKYPRLAQSYIFSSLRYKVSSYAIAKIEKDWADLSDIIKAGLHLDGCQCELPLRFGLPCKHYLLRAYQMGDPIPRSLLHPR